MALRSFAATVLPRFGCRLQPLAFQFSQNLERGFAQIVDGLKYTDDHEWVRVEGDTATVGITDHAQLQLGDLVFVETPKVGKELEQGHEYGVVESVKAASSLYAPISGKVIEVNGDLEGSPEQVNEDPYGGGWIAKLTMSKPAELDGLMDADAYRKFTGGE